MDFEKLPFGGDSRALWSLSDFRKYFWVLCRISYNWFSAGWYVRTFTLSISESTWSSLYPRFTNHCFNCSRRSLSFKPYNLSVCNSFLFILRWHNFAWRYCYVLFGLHYKSVSNLLPTFVTVTPKMLNSVVEQSIENLIVGCRLFIKLKSPFNFWESWVNIQKISSRYCNQGKV